MVAAKPPMCWRPGGGQGHLLDDLRIDVGLSQEEAQKRYPVGTTAVYRQGVYPPPGGPGVLKALDDRAGFCVLLRTLELLGMIR